MKTSVHLTASIILAAALYPAFQWKAALIIVGGVVIDIDHYFWYVYKYKKFNLADSYRFYIKNMEMKDFTNVTGILLVFHTVEFLIIMAILSYFSKFALMFAIGLLLHYALDLIYLYIVAKKFVVNHSIIHWIYKELIQKVSKI